MSLITRKIINWLQADGFPADSTSLAYMQATLLNMEALGMLISTNPYIILSTTDTVAPFGGAVNNMLIYANGHIYGLQGGAPLTYIQLVSNNINGIFQPPVGGTIPAAIETDSYFAFTDNPVTGTGAPPSYLWADVKTLPTLDALNTTVNQALINDTWHIINNAADPLYNGGLQNGFVPISGATPSLILEGIKTALIKGRVQLRGQITKTTSTNSLILVFTLPVGYRPGQKLYYTYYDPFGSTEFTWSIDTNGQVMFNAAAVAITQITLFLDNMSFLAEN